MQLTEDQKSQISQRLASGGSIADIQRLVNDEFKIHMTYMEVRFLIDDLEIEIVDAPKPPAPEAAKAPAAAPGDADVFDLEDAGGAVRVTIDRIKRPEAALSGSVVFGDGQRAQWFVDAYGRLGLDPDTPGYKPSRADIEDFQVELQRMMQAPDV